MNGKLALRPDFRKAPERQSRPYAFAHKSSHEHLLLRYEAEYADYPRRQHGSKDVRDEETRLVMPEGYTSTDRRRVDFALDALRTLVSTRSPAQKERTAARTFVYRTQMRKTRPKHATVEEVEDETEGPSLPGAEAEPTDDYWTLSKSQQEPGSGTIRPDGSVWHNGGAILQPETRERLRELHPDYIDYMADKAKAEAFKENIDRRQPPPLSRVETSPYPPYPPSGSRSRTRPLVYPKISLKSIDVHILRLSRLRWKYDPQLNGMLDGLCNEARARVSGVQDWRDNATVVFTIITIIFLPLSFVASVFGMNTSDVRNMELNQWGFWASAAPFTLLVILITVYFVDVPPLWRWLERKGNHRSTVSISGELVRRPTGSNRTMFLESVARQNQTTALHSGLNLADGEHKDGSSTTSGEDA